MLVVVVYGWVTSVIRRFILTPVILWLLAWFAFGSPHVLVASLLM